MVNPGFELPRIISGVCIFKYFPEEYAEAPLPGAIDEPIDDQSTVATSEGIALSGWSLTGSNEGEASCVPDLLVYRPSPLL